MSRINWCKFGIHDWEVLESVEEAQLESDIIAEMTDGVKVRVVHEGITKFIEKKVCLRCKKMINEFPEFTEKVVGSYMKTQVRKQMAKHLLDK